jgi:pleiotropic regulator 1
VSLLFSHKIKLASKLATEYKDVQTLPTVLAGQGAGPAGPKRPAAGPAPSGGQGMKLIGGPEQSTFVFSCMMRMARLWLMDRTSGGAAPGPAAEPRSLVKYRHQQGFAAEGGQASSRLSQALMRKKEAREIKPDYHAQCTRCQSRYQEGGRLIE